MHVKKDHPTRKQPLVTHKLTLIDPQATLNTEPLLGHAACGAGAFPMNVRGKRLCKRCWGL